MASSASSCVVDDDFESPTCWCGLKAPLKTSQTNKNPGRKYYACPKYKYNTGEANCQFFIWADIFQLLESQKRTRDNAVRKRKDDVLLREYEVEEKEDKLIERERVLDNQEEKIMRMVLQYRCARISLCMYWVIPIVIIFGWFGP
ncbi:uncharacterized protein LOC122309427 [Carya illinoinensis]|uniref:uncharacterized protein LOC122309427 n=1 Tax=Carya illinoinensis TaxID=32201 RepID=UPI001C718BBC|nr:uncharacterized protein LOC122309427 [Carya illinoinensis]